MELKDKMNVETEMNRVLKPLGLEGWKVMWEPDSSQNVNGRVLAEQKIIIVFAEDPERAKDVFLHEVIEVKIQKLIGNHIDTINGLIKIIQELNHIEKERTINGLVPLIRHVFNE